MTPDSKSAYVANRRLRRRHSVSQYDIDPVSGALTPKNPATVAASPAPSAVAVNPDGKSAYIANLGDGTVSQYDINPVSGALTAEDPGDGRDGCDTPSRWV